MPQEYHPMIVDCSPPGTYPSSDERHNPDFDRLTFDGRELDTVTFIPKKTYLKPQWQQEQPEEY